jgi:hypothetical protein
MTLRTTRHPAATAVVFTCPTCWDEFFPGKKPAGYSHGARTCIIHAACADDFLTDFLASDFTLVPGIVHRTSIPGLFCPPLDGDEPC